MFTGIIEELGKVISRTPADGYDNLKIAARNVLSDLEPGHSIAINGVCLTVAEMGKESFSALVIPETLSCSNLGALRAGSVVNLERALAADGRIHGHIMQGHVETQGSVIEIVVATGEVRITIAIDDEWMRYCIPKGSIALDGISLTIADMDNRSITVALIPFTLEHTTLGNKEVGDAINVETDLFARYIDRFIEHEAEESQWGLDMEKLHSMGFGES